LVSYGIRRRGRIPGPRPKQVSTSPWEEPMKSFIRHFVIALAAVVIGAGSAAAAPEGTLTYGVHITLASRWLDPGEAEGIAPPFMVLYAIHDALVKPMPEGLYTPCLAESFTA